MQKGSFSAKEPFILYRFRRLYRRGKRKLSERERDEEIRKLEKQMQEASRMLEFEYAAILRDRIIELRKENTK